MAPTHDRGHKQLTMRRYKVACAIVVIAAIGISWRTWGQAPNLLGWSFTESSEDRGVFYRLVSEYEHNGGAVDFDIVVGCNVKVTSYGDGGSSFDAFRYPSVFAKKTKDGGELWQLVPDACQGQTTANGRVPLYQPTELMTRSGIHRFGRM